MAKNSQLAIHRKTPKKINWDDPEQARVAVLVKFGYSDIGIKKYCPSLSDGEIKYRVVKSGFKRKEWRDGESVESQYALQRIGAYVEGRTSRQLPRPAEHAKTEHPAPKESKTLQNMKRAKATHS